MIEDNGGDQANIEEILLNCVNSGEFKNIDWKSVFMQILADDDAYREIKRYSKREFGFDVGKLAGALGRADPDKKYSIKEIDIPHLEIAESVFILKDEGYSPSQIAEQLQVYPSAISRILEQEKALRRDVTKTKFIRVGKIDKLKILAHSLIIKPILNRL